MSYLLTICIPTYNRAEMTINLINTLPVDDNVEYIVIDDGSREEEVAELEKFISESNSSVKLYKKKNGGKLSAVRAGLEYALGAFFMDLDDDDLFNKQHLTNILTGIELFNENLKYDSKLVGFSGLCEDVNSGIIGDKFPEDKLISNFLAIRADYKVAGDKKEVILTQALRSIRIKFYEGERRVPTSTQWALLADKSILFFNKAFIIKNYLETGLSKNLGKVRVKSPFSSRQVYEVRINHFNTQYKNFRYFMRSAVNFYRFSLHGATPFFPVCKSSQVMLLTIPAIPIAFLLYLKDKIFYK
ncbi:MAG: glycosyltransferase [Bacteroidota bacterium]